MAASWLANPHETRIVLDRYGLATKHRLGQNFLVNDSVIGQILELAELEPNDFVLEIGPGIGTLTVALLPQVARIVAVEADKSLAPVLAQTCKKNASNLQLIWGDALQIVPGQLRVIAPGITKCVSNLPYQIAATLILKILSEVPEIERLVVMVQSEVADRIAADPGTKAYGAYTAKLALWGTVTGRFEVSPSCFLPPPHVKSAVIRIDRISQDELSCAQKKKTAAVISAAFAQRRKTLRNSMSHSGYESRLLDEAFETCGISGGVRAETLDPKEFVQLAEALGW